MHLPIRVVGRSAPVEVPFQLQPSFKFACHVPGHGVQEFVADLSNRDALTAHVSQVEMRSLFGRSKAYKEAEAILAAVLSRLGLVEAEGMRAAGWGDASQTLNAIGLAHEAEAYLRDAATVALTRLTPVWRDRKEPAPTPHIAADILDSYYQQVQDEVLGEWEDKAQREAADYLTAQQARGNSEVQP